MIFFTKNPNLKMIFWRGAGDGVGGQGKYSFLLRVQIKTKPKKKKKKFFYKKNPNLKKKKNFFFGRGGGGGGLDGGRGVEASDSFHYESKIKIIFLFWKVGVGIGG